MVKIREKHVSPFWYSEPVVEMAAKFNSEVVGRAFFHKAEKISNSQMSFVKRKIHSRI